MCKRFENDCAKGFGRSSEQCVGQVTFGNRNTSDTSKGERDGLVAHKTNEIKHWLPARRGNMSFVDPVGTKTGCLALFGGYRCKPRMKAHMFLLLGVQKHENRNPLKLQNKFKII